MKVGITGTREGIDETQRTALEYLLRTLKEQHPDLEVHHGDCVGADAAAHDICRSLRIRVVVHPPDRDAMRAWRIGDVMLVPKPYLERNQDIVDAVELLIALPRSPEVRRSGTWATARAARKAGVKVTVLVPGRHQRIAAAQR